TGYESVPCASLSRRLFGRMSGQFCSMYSRHAGRAASPYTTRQPAGTSANTGHRLCCSSSLTKTKKLALSSSNGFVLTRSPNRLKGMGQGPDHERGPFPLQLSCLGITDRRRQHSTGTDQFEALPET